ncbi:MAG: hypothetical protein Q9165_001323 [Trypethelium subeluteriae]
MPLYDVEYVTPLTDETQEQLAKAITRIHTERFGTPSYFVNVRLFRRCVSKSVSWRSIELYNDHCSTLVRKWEQLVGKGPEKELRAVWIESCLTTALDANFFRPRAGEEKKWLQEHWTDFEALADAGDEEMKGLMKELRTRADFAEISISKDKESTQAT